MSAAASGAWLVADPGLKTASGHNAGALATLAAALGAHGRFFGHQDPEADLAAQAERLGVRFERFFRASFYDGYARDWTLAQAHPYINALADDYVHLLRRATDEAGEHGRVLHHTMDWPHLYALAAALARRPGTSRHAVFLMFNPGVGAGGGVVAPRRFLGYRLALEALRRHERVQLYASCSEFAAAYGGVLGLAEPPPIHPCFFFDPAAASSAAQKSHVLLYAGDAKEEKGFCELPALAGVFLRHAPDAQLKIHYNLNACLEAPRVRQAAQALEALAREHASLELRARFIPESELAALLRDCACALFNYRPSTYANQSSGLLWQACAAGAPVAVIGESWLAREAQRMHPLVRVFGHTQALAAELQRRGKVRFEARPFDAGYRARLFTPLAEFMRAAA